MKPFYTWCPCRRAIGQTDGEVLRIGDVEIRRPITLWCGCGRPTNWRPIGSRAGAPLGIALEPAPEQAEPVKVEL